MAFLQVLRNATRPAMRQVRNFGGHSKEEALKSMNSMITNTKIGVAICGAMTVINVVIHFSHGHHEDHAPAYEYRRIRNKPMPWDEHACDLFDLDCKAKFRKGEKVGLGQH